MMTKSMPRTQATGPALIESAPRLGADRPLLQVDHVGRQGAGAQQQRQVLRRLQREPAADLAAAAEDRLLDPGRADHLVVEHDGEDPADVVPGRLAEPLAAHGIEAEGDHGLAVLVVSGLGVVQILAPHHGTALDHVAHALLVGRGQDDMAGRRPARVGVGGRIHEVEGQLRGLAEDVLDPIRILDARDLDQDPVGALALDRGFGQPGLVHAQPDDLDDLAHDAGPELAQALLGDLDLDSWAVLGDHVGLHVVADQLASALHLAGIAQLDEQQVALEDAAAVLDPRPAQRRGDAVDDVVQALGQSRLELDLHQEVRAAPQVEAEVDLLARQPARHVLGQVAVEHVGCGVSKAQQQHDRRQDHLPSRNLNHEDFAIR